jgi:nucleoside-diphosphate-sugar epimerase
MVDVQGALGALARKPPRVVASTRRALVIGAAGALGAAVLEQLLATRRFERVGALTDQPIQPAVHGFAPVRTGELHAFAADCALIVFDRQRAANGREAAFVRPEPQGLAALAEQLHATGVRHLIVVVPHTPSLLPMTLQQGLASLDEAAVAALGFEQLVFMRMAQNERAEDGLDAPRRLARWMLSQLHWMIPQREQPVRVETVAKVAAALAVQLHDAPHGTRVVPAVLMWQAAQQRDVQTLAREWLAPRSSP